MKKLKMRTPDGVDENIKKIMELFPNCVVEAWEEGGIHEGGSHQEPGQGQKGQIQHQGQFPQPGRIQDSPLRKCIDFDILRQELSGYIVDGPRERYRLDWPGKKEALLEIGRASCRERV